MLHLSQFTCHAAIVLLHVSCFTYLTLSCILHVSYFMFHASRFTLHTLHISMLHVSCFTFHASRFTLHISCFTFHASCDVTWWCDMCTYNVFSVSSMLGTCIQQSIQIWEGFAPRSVSSAPLPPRKVPNLWNQMENLSIALKHHHTNFHVNTFSSLGVMSQKPKWGVPPLFNPAPLPLFPGGFFSNHAYITQHAISFQNIYSFIIKYLHRLSPLQPTA